MRWIVISLLLVNALILGGRWLGTTEPANVSAPKPITIAPAIELLPDGAVTPLSVPTDTDTAVKVSSNEVEAADGELAAQPGEALTLPSPDSDLPGQSTAEVASADLPSSTQANPNAPQPSTAELARVDVPASMQCAWTPWAEKALKEFSPAELLQTEQQEQEIGRSYLVYVPAKASREVTLQRLAELKSAGIDAAFLNKGPQAGGISLGLFSKPESMQLRLRELQKAGIADVSGIERIRTEPRIRYLLRWTGEKTPSSVQNQALVSCNDIASAAVGQ